MTAAAGRCRRGTGAEARSDPAAARYFRCKPGYGIYLPVTDVEKIEEEGITIFYVEEYTNEASVNSLVEQTKSGTMPDGVILKTLHTMEMPPKDTNDGYADLMKENLDNLLAGMEC